MPFICGNIFKTITYLLKKSFVVVHSVKFHGVADHGIKFLFKRFASIATILWAFYYISQTYRQLAMSQILINFIFYNFYLELH